jgi:hypothetical protein
VNFSEVRCRRAISTATVRLILRSLQKADKARDRNPPAKFILYLGGAGFGGSSVVVTAGENKDSFGRSIDMTHDINGDTLRGSRRRCAALGESAGATSGRAYVYFGNANGVAKTPDLEYKLGTLNDLFGSAVSTGDLTGDGQADLVIGAPHYGAEAVYNGAAYVFAGGKGY